MQPVLVTITMHQQAAVITSALCFDSTSQIASRSFGALAAYGIFTLMRGSILYSLTMALFHAIAA
jgi:hypothetical protein